uniref:DUF4220 domain-containing protein n=1 Tax=Oryza brachyantha TaxID=4533 RepID=J3LVH8_ORYBR
MYLAYPVEEVDQEKKEKKKKEEEKMAEETKPKPKPRMKPVEHHNVQKIRKLEEALDFLPEFQESILILHIATDVVCMYTESEQKAASSKPKHCVEVIKALSDYMMFLVAVRPGMLPGLKLRSLYEATQDALANIWSSKKESSRCSSITRAKCVADILRDMEKERKKRKRRQDKSDHWKPGYRTKNWEPDYTTELYEVSIVLSDGIKLADHLLQWLHRNYWLEFPRPESYEAKFGLMFPELRKLLNGPMHDEPDKWSKLLEHIFEELVRLLINASVKCTRDSHAKQLSRGGELMTIVWMLVEHAGVFRVDRLKR